MSARVCLDMSSMDSREEAGGDASLVGGGGSSHAHENGGQVTIGVYPILKSGWLTQVARRVVRISSLARSLNVNLKGILHYSVR